MKFTTARRIIKESKKGLVAHSDDLVREAHDACRAYHEKVAKGEAAVRVIHDVTAIQVAQGRPVVPKGMTIEEFAHRQVKRARLRRNESTATYDGMLPPLTKNMTNIPDRLREKLGKRR